MAEMREWTYRDRTGWPPGPWDAEPDKVEWRDHATGLPCIIRREPIGGAWCGYVAVPPGHPWHGLRVSALAADVNVHGGLTFASPCHEAEDGTGICHVPEPGEPVDVWWLGFDCAHHPGDFDPGRVRVSPTLEDEVYRTVEYVAAQVTALAAQVGHHSPAGYSAEPSRTAQAPGERSSLDSRSSER